MSTFNETAEAFRSRLTKEDLGLLQGVDSVGDLEHAIRAIEKKQSARKSIRNINKIRPFIASLEQYASVIEVFVTTKPEILALLWGPIKLCLQVSLRCY